jgi:hypothetical protein
MTVFSVTLDSGKVHPSGTDGRRYFYARVSFGRKSYWLMRWDTERTENRKDSTGKFYRPFAYSRDRAMSWTVGSFTT